MSNLPPSDPEEHPDYPDGRLYNSGAGSANPGPDESAESALSAPQAAEPEVLPAPGNEHPVYPDGHVYNSGAGSANPGPAADGGHIPDEEPAVTNGDPVGDQTTTSWDGYPSSSFARSEETFATTRSPRRRGGVGILIGALVGALIVGGLAGGAVSAGLTSSELKGGAAPSASASTDSAGVRTVQERVDSDLAAVIKAAEPSVVTIGVQISGGSAGTGSGEVLNSQGYIITNAHVATLEGQSANATISVQTSTGDIYAAKLVGYDALADTAVIKIPANAKGTKPITFANSDLVQVGEPTIAIGSPLGLQGTVTSGIVSAINRPISVQSSAVGAAEGTAVSLNAIQTDAAINSGNSGGALLNANGDLIGINDSIATSGQSSGSIGIGFAIPANYVKRVAQEIIANGSATHGLLGATIGNAAQSSSAAFGFGAVVREVSAGGAAAKAGLRAGDVITMLDGTVISDATQLTALVKEDAAGATVKVTYKRGQNTQSANVVLGSDTEANR